MLPVLFEVVQSSLHPVLATYLVGSFCAFTDTFGLHPAPACFHAVTAYKKLAMQWHPVGSGRTPADLLGHTVHPYSLSCEHIHQACMRNALLH
jgi:hypothetical protein